MEKILNLQTILGPVVIVGMGKSGESALRFLKHARPDLIIHTFDQKQTNADFKTSEAVIAINPKTLVVSPGVPLRLPWIQQLAKEGCFLTSEISLATSVLTTEKMIAVTGSVGKSTTVSLLQQGLSGFSKKFFVGGNLGTPFCDYAFEKITTGNAADWIVLELSSYQLENCVGLTLNHSAIVSLSPNHLERYDSLNDYYETKWSLVARTTGRVLLNLYGYDLVDFAKSRAGFEKCTLTEKNSEFCKSLPWQKRKLLGEHNKENILLAAMIAKEAGWPISATDALMQFPGLDHRLQNIGRHKGILFINDSKATSMDSVRTAVLSAGEELQPTQKLITLLGGRDKNLPWEQLTSLQSQQRQFVFFGECAELAKSKSGLGSEVFPTLALAFNRCCEHAKSGDVILLSPGGTSLDEFKNFEDRGEYFNQLVINFGNK